LQPYWIGEDEAERLGYTISLAATNLSPERLRSAVQQMLGARVSGLAILASEGDKAAFEIITQSGVPCVYLDLTLLLFLVGMSLAMEYLS